MTPAQSRGAKDTGFGAAILILGMYLVLAQIVTPLMSYSRVMGEDGFAALRNIILPPLLVALVMASGPAEVLKPRSAIQIALILVLIQAAARGYNNIIDSNTMRDYFSHLFQIASAYMLIGVGLHIGKWSGENFWRAFAFLTLLAVGISTLVTVSALGRGEVGRYYTPAYSLILVSAFAAVYTGRLAILSLVVALLSNKRGPIISILVLIVQGSYITSRRRWRRRKWHMVDLVALGAMAIGLFAIAISWASNYQNSNTALGRAVNITYDRMAASMGVFGDDTAVADIDAGRSNEVATAMNSLDGVDYLFGAGVGWAVNIGGGRWVQNIHFTPLSLTAVFGAPFAVFLYMWFAWLLTVVTFSPRARFSGATQKMAPVYLTGAVFHSIFAYSLFIDWLVFFFAGVCLSAINQKAVRASAPILQASGI